jgi:xanthine dehydrogenase accessory factor
MHHAFFDKAQELLQQNTPFAIAMVVRAEKPTSGKPGDKALITIDGTMYGWVGGSCSQPTVIREALKALKDGKSHFIRLSPDPEKLTPREGLTDLPMTCFGGGTLEIYIEPQFPQPRLMVVGSLPIARALVGLGKVMNYETVAVNPDGEGSPLTDAHHLVTHITDIPQYVHPDTYIVVATHGNFDEAALEHALRAKARYIGLVASHKRFESVLEYLKMQGFNDADLAQIKAPAGLDIQARQGDEIALSILAEIVQRRRSAAEEADWSQPTPIEEERDDGHHDHDQHHEHEHHHASAHEVAIDPVCGMGVEIATARYSCDYKGITYYFCGEGCKESFVQNPQQYLEPKPTIAIDPVCHMEVEIATAHYQSAYQGTTYYFCAAGCKTRFDKNPERYLPITERGT